MASSIDIREIIDLPQEEDVSLYTVVVTRTGADGTVTGARIPLAQIVGVSGGTEPEPNPVLKLSADGVGFQIGPDGLPLLGQTITVSLEKKDISDKVVWTINRDITIPEDATEVVISGDKEISIGLENVAPAMGVRFTETSYHGWYYNVTATGEALFVNAEMEAEMREEADLDDSSYKVTMDSEDIPSMEMDNDNPPAIFYYCEGPSAQHLVRSDSATRVYVRADVHGLFNMEHNDHALCIYFIAMSAGGMDEEGNQIPTLQHTMMACLDRVREGVYSAVLTFYAGELSQGDEWPFNYLIAGGYIMPVNDPTKAGTRGGFTLDGLTFISVTNNMTAFAEIGLDDEEKIKSFLDAQDYHEGAFTAIGALPDPVIGDDPITITVEADGVEDSIELPVTVSTPVKDLVLEVHPTSLVKGADGVPLIGQAAVVRAFEEGVEGSIVWSDNIGLDIREGAHKVVISTSLMRSIGSISNTLKSIYTTSSSSQPESSWWTNSGDYGRYQVKHVSEDGEAVLRGEFQEAGVALLDDVPLLPTGLEGESSTSFNLLSGLDGSPLALSGTPSMLYLRARFNSIENVSISDMYCILNVRIVGDGQDRGEVTPTSILAKMHRVGDFECSCVVTLDAGTFATNTETPPIQLTDCMVLPRNDVSMEGKFARYSLNQLFLIPIMAHADALSEIGVSSADEVEAFFDSSKMESSSFTPKGLVRNPAIDGTNISLTASVDGITKSVMIPFVTED